MLQWCDAKVKRLHGILVVRILAYVIAAGVAGCWSYTYWCLYGG